MTRKRVLSSDKVPYPANRAGAEIETRFEIRYGARFFPRAWGRQEQSID